MNIPDKAVEAAYTTYAREIRKWAYGPDDGQMPNDHAIWRAALEAAMREMQPTWVCDAEDTENGAVDLESLVDQSAMMSGESALQMRVYRFFQIPDVYMVAHVNDADQWVISEHATEAEADAAFGLVPPPEGEGK